MIPFSMQAVQAISKIGYEDGHILNAKLVPEMHREMLQFLQKICTRITWKIGTDSTKRFYTSPTANKTLRVGQHSLKVQLWRLFKSTHST